MTRVFRFRSGLLRIEDGALVVECGIPPVLGLTIGEVLHQRAFTERKPVTIEVDDCSGGSPQPLDGMTVSPLGYAPALSFVLRGNASWSLEPNGWVAVTLDGGAVVVQDPENAFPFDPVEANEAHSWIKDVGDDDVGPHKPPT